MTKIYYSCDEIPRDWASYSALCNSIELRLDDLDNPPKIQTLNSWRVKTPRGFGFLLHVDRDVICGLNEAAATGKNELDDATRRGWEKTIARADALAAKALVLSTPIEFTPSADTRHQLEIFSRELLATSSRPLIWEAQGMWDPILTREWAQERNILLAHDPFIALREEESLGKGDVAFIINERGGMRRDFDRFDFRDLLDQLTSHNRVFCLLRGRHKWNHATLLRDALQIA